MPFGDFEGSGIEEAIKHWLERSGSSLPLDITINASEFNTGVAAKCIKLVEQVSHRCEKIDLYMERFEVFHPLFSPSTRWNILNSGYAALKSEWGYRKNYKSPPPLRRRSPTHR